MFKAPPTNLIESLLMEEDEEVKTDVAQKKVTAAKPVPIVRKNNFMKSDRQQSRSSSRKGAIKKDRSKSRKKAPQFCVEEDEEDEDSEEENPF